MVELQRLTDHWLLATDHSEWFEERYESGNRIG